jgi:cell division transport system permease protein
MSNMWIGLFSGLMANALLVCALYMAQKSEPAIMTLMPIGDLLIVGLVVIAFGMTICMLCAYLSVNRFLRMRSNDLYFI